MSFQVKFYVPILVLLGLLGLGAILLHWHCGHDASKTIEFSAGVVGGITAIYSLLLGIQQRRTSSAAEFMKRWNSPDFQEYRKEIRSTIDDFEDHSQASRQNSETGPFNPLKKGDELRTKAILSFWEEIAIAVLYKEADERLLKEFFYTAVTIYYQATESYIKQRRIDEKQPTAYEKYEGLYRRWCQSPLGTIKNSSRRGS